MSTKIEIRSPGEKRLATPELAALMVELEREWEARRPDAVVLRDDSDRSLAAALVASKLLITIEAEPATAAASTNARLIERMSGTYTASP